MSVSIWDMPVDRLDVSARALNLMEDNGVRLVAELALTPENTVWRWRSLGPKTMREIKDALAAHGLTLGMKGPPKAERETIAEVLTVTIQHGEDDLREWPMANQPPGALATIDRRAVSCVWGGPAWCWVHVSGGPPVMLGAPYDELVAWWRGGR